MNAFIEKIKDGAIETQRKYGVLASLTIAQAILETGWGKCSVGNNVFGIKASPSWTGGTVTCVTGEVYDGQAVCVSGTFRTYSSIADSIADHAQLFIRNSCYHNIIGCIDYKQACRNVQADGYATDPDYASKLISIIEDNDLQQFDNQGATPAAPASSGTAHHIGENVVFSTCYASSTDPTSKAILASNMSRNHGTITSIAAGAHNPYLLDGGLCWVNDGDIRGPYSAPAPAAAPTTDASASSAGTAHHIGENVIFSTCYSSSTDSTDKAIPASKMARNHGTITSIIPGRRNPYLIDNGLCWVNDGDIRSSYSASAPVTYLVKTGDTLSQIAVDNDTTVENLVKLNGIENENDIQAGWTLRVR